ncbi:Uncharacterized protein SCF082_LOCUS36862 [Durusdinium trenchii]|uniref:Uncharacterized protein n=1 Tax=Durusdinium trenchii TaxID=1381693 RepID=A0ABP0PKB5_9DINO
MKEQKMARAAAKKSGTVTTVATTAGTYIDKDSLPPEANTSYYEKLMDSMNVILANHNFCDIQTAEALPSVDGAKTSGVQEPFNSKACEIALRKEGTYRCGINLLWIDPFASITPAVPLDHSRVVELGQFAYPDGKTPRHLQENFHVATDAADVDLLGKRGKWRGISPEEMQHSLIFALAKCIEDKVDDDCLQDWRKIFLTAPCVITIVGNDDQMFWEAFRKRQQVIASYDCVKRSARQLAHEVRAFKVKKEKETGESLSIKDITDLFGEKKDLMAKSTRQGDMADGFVKDCLYVYDKMLSDPDCNQVLDRLEALFGLGSPLNSLSKLRVVIEKSENLETRQWVLQVLCDMIENGQLDKDTISKGYLQGSGTSASLVELLKLKRSTVQHFLQVELPRNQFDTEDLKMIYEKIMTVKNYRKYVNPSKTTDSSILAEVQWMSSLKGSSLLVLRLMEDDIDLLYSVTLNGSLVVLLKKGKGVSPLELLDIETFNVRWQPCLAAKNNELAAEKALYQQDGKNAKEDVCAQIAEGSLAPQPSKYPKGSREHFVATAAEQVQIYVSLVPEPATMAGVAKVVKESHVAQHLGAQGKGCIMIHFDAQLFGESLKRPDRRFPPLSPALVKKLAHGALKGRGCSPNSKVGDDHYDKPLDGDYVFLNDGGRNVLESLLSPFKAKETGKASIAHYLDTTEITLCLSQDQLCVIEKELYGAKMVGCDAPTSEEKDKEEVRDGGAYEPVFFHHLLLFVQLPLSPMVRHHVVTMWRARQVKADKD